MKKLLFLFCLTLFISCESDGDTKNCDIITEATINLVNPEYINLTVPGGWSYANGGPKGLILYNSGTYYKAFSRDCPEDNDCKSGLTVKDGLKMTCPCDETSYSILDGSPQTEGISNSVCEFRVIIVNDVTLKITNF